MGPEHIGFICGAVAFIIGLAIMCLDSNGRNGAAISAAGLIIMGAPLLIQGAL